jgi:glycosyltransferase involved in cell wall biosynthesis
VIHDGIDAGAAPAKANTGLTLSLRDGQELRQGEPIITFVSRTIEPYRGCHSFIRSIPLIEELQPNARVVIVGAEKSVSYGSVCPQGEWKDRFMAEIEGSYDPSRLHFAGSLGYADFLTLLKLSQAHVYLTCDLSLRAQLEAMSTACAIVGSATAPVMEVIRDGHNGLLVDFFSPKAIAEAVDQLLRDRKLAKQLGAQARKDALARYSLERCLPRQLELIDLVASGALGR